MITPSNDEIGDGKAHFNIRVDSALRQEIEKRAEAEGVPLASWCRKAFRFALQHMDNNEITITSKQEMREVMRELLRDEGLLKKE
ncbi:hypothetical protein [Methanorbis rubei]|uniref:Uncharacterized protein n=1 Tax=Methanorbis rubei TaxID=3028300 RepID=A0AAE4MGM3_9EURY|nr:hypothetical protein [Methanocorpusculaceae archaeon Cs1]